MHPALNHRTVLESALRHERTVLAIVLILIPIICWTWIALMARDMYGSYLAVWAAFSTGATALQRVLSELLILTPMMEPASPAAGAVVLVLAGLYQLTPLKRMCLRSCRSPLTFLMQHWRTGHLGAFRLGVDHGSIVSAAAGR